MSNKAKLKSVGGAGSVPKAGAMQSPCTITEAVQIARGVAEDVLTDYHRSQGNMLLSMTIQIDILKELAISSGMITEEEFRNKYMEKAKEIQKMQNDRIAEALSKDPEVTAAMETKAGDVEIKVEN